MSLRAFHALFIAVSAVCCAGLAAWCVWRLEAGDAGWGPLAAVGVVGFLGLVPYLIWFVRRYREEF